MKESPIFRGQKTENGGRHPQLFSTRKEWKRSKLGFAKVLLMWYQTGLFWNFNEFKLHSGEMLHVLSYGKKVVVIFLVEPVDL